MFCCLEEGGGLAEPYKVEWAFFVLGGLSWSFVEVDWLRQRV